MNTQPKKKTLRQEAIESLKRRAGQYERNNKIAFADILRGAAERLEKEGEKWPSKS